MLSEGEEADMTTTSQALGWAGSARLVTVMAVLFATPTEAPAQPPPRRTVPDVSDLKVAETWRFEYDVATDGAFVPDIADYKGKLFMYLALGGDRGVVSFSSLDGKTWTQDAGVRVAEGKGLSYGHPYTAVGPDSKLYLFVQTATQGTRGPYHVSVCESTDGIHFSQPRAIIRGEDFGGNHAAHGRILRLKDGRYLLAVSAGYDPPDPRSWAGAGSQLAYSDDLKQWEFAPTFFAGCHDPTFATSRGTVRLYCQFQGRTLLRFDSPDGYRWDSEHPVGRVEFLDWNGDLIDRVDDIDAHTFSDGTTRMFISVHINRQTGVWSTVEQSR